MVNAQLEGFSFSVSICVIIEVFHLCASTNYTNRNIIFLSNYMLQIFVSLSMGVFVIHVNGLC